MARIGETGRLPDRVSDLGYKFGQWGEAFKANRLPISLFVVLGLVLTLAIATAPRSAIDTWYGYLFDPVVGLGTFVVAVAVWLRTAKTKWEEALPKTLMVRFTVGSEVFLEVVSLPLVAPGDIRSFSQQAIRTWNKDDVKLGLNFTIRPGVPVKRRDGRWVQQWVCEYPLDKAPGNSCTNPDHKGAPHVWRIDPLSAEKPDICAKAADQ